MYKMSIDVKPSFELQPFASNKLSRTSRMQEGSARCCHSTHLFRTSLLLLLAICYPFRIESDRSIYHLICTIHIGVLSFWNSDRSQ